jgi:hypothetical protein
MKPMSACTRLIVHRSNNQCTNASDSFGKVLYVGELDNRQDYEYTATSSYRCRSCGPLNGLDTRLAEDPT